MYMRRSGERSVTIDSNLRLENQLMFHTNTILIIFTSTLLIATTITITTLNPQLMGDKNILNSFIMQVQGLKNMLIMLHWQEIIISVSSSSSDGHGWKILRNLAKSLVFPTLPIWGGISSTQMCNVLQPGWVLEIGLGIIQRVKIVIICSYMK